MLEIKNLTKSYGKKQILKDVSFTVQKGETVVIMGPSGCGKSTTIRCINRLIEPDAGEIIFNGTSVLDLKHDEVLKLRHRIGFVFQDFNLVRRFTVLENVMFGLVLRGEDQHEAKEKALDSLRRVGMQGHILQRPEQLSGGQQQRVAIARMLALQPELMLWDEPTASLDPILVGEVLGVMEELVRDFMTTMVVVTHELSFAIRVADRVILVDEGRIVEEGPPKQVFSTPVSSVGKKYRDLLNYQVENMQCLAGKEEFASKYKNRAFQLGG